MCSALGNEFSFVSMNQKLQGIMMRGLKGILEWNKKKYLSLESSFFFLRRKRSSVLVVGKIKSYIFFFQFKIKSHWEKELLFSRSLLVTNQNTSKLLNNLCVSLCLPELVGFYFVTLHENFCSKRFEIFLRGKWLHFLSKIFEDVWCYFWGSIIFFT